MAAVNAAQSRWAAGEPGVSLPDKSCPTLGMFHLRPRRGVAVLVAGFPTGSFQANCFVLAAEVGGPCVVVDPGQGAEQPLDDVLRKHRLDRANDEGKADEN